MKDKFIEKCGLLFMKCEPEPLEMDSEMPCLAHLIQDGSRMGIYNRKRYNDKQLASYYVLCWHIYSRDCVSCGDHYSRYEIVAKHCPEGSREWALWQMLNGKKVCNHSYHGGVPLKISDSSVQKWARNAFEYNCEIVSFMRYFKEYQTGWKICEETKPKPEVGKWYRKLDEPYHYQCTRINKDGFDVRKAGDEHVISLPHTLMEEFWETFIEPDFTNAEVGYKVYNVAQGYTEIDYIEFNEAGNMVITMAIKNSRCANDNEECYKDGRKKYDTHPTYFHSAAQCAAYFAEVALKERGE